MHTHSYNQSKTRPASQHSRGDYAGQREGVNEHGVPYINGQHAHNSVQQLDRVLEELGYSSLEELVAAAQC